MATLNARQQRQLNEIFAALQAELRDGVSLEDRKSTRLNSSH